MPLAYLAGAIDGVPYGSARGWRDAATAELEKAGIACYSPAAAFSGVVASGRAIRERLDLGAPTLCDVADTTLAESITSINLHSILQCDIVLAEVCKPGLHAGTLWEIGAAAQNGKPVVVWGTESMRRNPPIALQLGGIRLETSLEGALAAVVDAVDGLMREATTIRQSAWHVCLDGGKVPVRSYDGDAGYDLFTKQDVTIPSGRFLDVPTGVFVSLPRGVAARIIGRSSTWRKLGLMVVEGLIDNGYQGELFCGAYNSTDSEVHVERGSRIAQLVPFNIVTLPDPTIVPDVAHFPPSERSSRGFGSSGA